MFNSEDVAVVRHVVQRILVPCVFVIGLLGNSVSIYVLTRRRMRCTTNIYLTALAVTDIIYLTMALLLSLKHYSYVKSHYENYWRFYGIFVWMCDACAYISIYIAMCFTIERFIAIRYPLKRQTFCTESLAKKVITGVALFCLFSTISTAFEHQYLSEYKLINITTGKPCNLTVAQTTAYEVDQTTDNTELWHSGGSGNGPISLPTQNHTPPSNRTLNTDEFKEITRIMPAEIAGNLNIPNRNIPVRFQATAKYFLDSEFLLGEDTLQKIYRQRKRQLFSEEENGDAKRDVIDFIKDERAMYDFNMTTSCENVTFYENSLSELAQNSSYTITWYYSTLIVFVLVPLFVLVTFNCFLIMLVRKSKNLRGDLTNANSIRKSRKERKPNVSAVSQENRVTVTLIAVVLVFIICQLPWAMYLIVSEHVEIDPNLQAILGNIFNFLAAINAAANFFLYCVLSDKYRKTVRELITGYKYRMHRHNNTNASLYTNATTNGSRRYRQTSSSVIIK